MVDLVQDTLSAVRLAAQEHELAPGLEADPLADFAMTQLPLWCDDKPWFHIRADGSWFYQHDALPMKFARMFSDVLYCLDGEYQLITPV